MPPTATFSITIFRFCTFRKRLHWIKGNIWYTAESDALALASPFFWSFHSISCIAAENPQRCAGDKFGEEQVFHVLPAKMERTITDRPTTASTACIWSCSERIICEHIAHVPKLKLKNFVRFDTLDFVRSSLARARNSADTTQFRENGNSCNVRLWYSIRMSVVNHQCVRFAQAFASNSVRCGRRPLKIENSHFMVSFVSHNHAFYVRFDAAYNIHQCNHEIVDVFGCWAPP